jgi:hypothetical protein
MADHNPYAPSRAALKTPAVAGAGAGDAWADGKWVVMEIDGALPHRCVKCNAPAEMPLKKITLAWHHPAIYLLLLFWVVIYLIVALITRRTVKIDAGLCEEHRVGRRNVLIAGSLGLLLCIPIGMVLASTIDADLGVIAGIVVGLGSIILLLAKGRLLYAKKIDDDIARIGGAGPEFLASLPSGPAPQRDLRR